MARVVSFSGGKDSTALLLMMVERGVPIDEVIYFDGGWDYPEMPDHIRKVEEYTGLKITRLESAEPFDYWFGEHVLMRGKRAGQRGYGFARPMARWCTKIKTTTCDMYLKIRYGSNVEQCIGIAADELRRVRDKRYPLVEWGVTEHDALEYCKARGFDWGGLYDHRSRLSCWCCPLQGIADYRQLRRDHPTLWLKLLEMEKQSCNTLRIDKSAAQLEAQFANEDNQLAIDF